MASLMLANMSCNIECEAHLEASQSSLTIVRGNTPPASSSGVCKGAPHVCTRTRGLRRESEDPYFSSRLSS